MALPPERGIALAQGSIAMAMLLLLLVPLSLAAQGQEAPPAGRRVVVTAGRATFYSCPSEGCPRVGTAQKGALLSARACPGPCVADVAWVQLADQAFAEASALAEVGAPEPAPPPDAYAHGTVRGGGAKLYARPEEGAGVGRVRPGRSLAFLVDPALVARGWLPRVWGGYVRADSVRMDSPSALEGEMNPADELAFLLREVRLDNGQSLARYARLKVLKVTRATVETPAGPLPRPAVRLFHRVARPPLVPEHARWVHVDLDEQTLGAYEGDRAVFATLVSTGKAATPTSPGLYRVYLKTRHARMHGEGYDVEEVPTIQYFNRSEGLHGAFWHDHFGRAVTHGCVNLSPRDADWLFTWAPPELPAGWHTRFLLPAEGSLWVWVGRALPSGPAKLAVGP